MQGIPADSRVFPQIERQKKKQANQTELRVEQLPSLLARQLLLPPGKLGEAASICNNPVLGVVPDAFSKSARDSSPNVTAALSEMVKRVKQARKEGRSVMGVVPDAFSKSTGNNAPNVVAALNEMAKRITQAREEGIPWSTDVEIVDGALVELKNPVVRRLRQTQKRAIHIERLDSGFAGDVYKLEAGGQEFVLKVFRGDIMADREIAIGMHLTQGRQTSNLSDFFVGNLANDGSPWALMEFIPQTAKLEERVGQTLNEQNIKISDDNDKNKVNGIRIDHGGTVQRTDASDPTPSEDLKQWMFLKMLAIDAPADALMSMLHHGAVAKGRRSAHQSDA